MVTSKDSATAVFLVGFAACFGFILLPAVAGTSGEAATTSPNATEQPIDIETDRVNIYLHAQQTVVEHDESVIFIHSVTNYITNEDDLTVQLILEAPQGSDIHGTEGADEGSGSQFTTTTTLEPGEHESMRIHVNLHEPGEHELTGQAVYFFGDDQQSGEGVEVSIPVEQQSPPPSIEEQIVIQISQHRASVVMTASLIIGAFILVNFFSPISKSIETSLRRSEEEFLNMFYLFVVPFITGVAIHLIDKLMSDLISSSPIIASLGPSQPTGEPAAGGSMIIGIFIGMVISFMSINSLKAISKFTTIAISIILLSLTLLLITSVV